MDSGPQFGCLREVEPKLFPWQREHTNRPTADNGLGFHFSRYLSTACASLRFAMLSRRVMTCRDTGLFASR